MVCDLPKSPLEISPKNTSIRFNIAEVLFVTKEWKKAHDLLQEIIREIPPQNMALARLVEFKILLCKIKLGQKEILLGRGEDCDVQVPDKRVSRHHARIEPYEVAHIGSRNLSDNGTRLNAAMLDEPAKLNPGDRVYIED